MTARPSHVIIHAGFHKTGTSSAQAFLRANKDVIRRHAAFFLRWRFPDVVVAARAYSNRRDDLSREKFRFRFLGLLGDITVRKDRPLLMSCEELIGHMPGHAQITDFSAAPDLCEDMADLLRHIWGEDLRITFLFTTREAEAWFASAWAHCVLTSKLKVGLDAFKDRMPQAADFAAITQAVADRVGPAQVDAVALEALVNRPLGPGAVFLPYLDLPDEAMDALVDVAPQNVSPPRDMVERALRRNRLKG